MSEGLEPIQQAVYDIADALDNPIDRHGNHYDFSHLKPCLAWHLARAGIGRVPGQAVIKRREVAGGLVDWVPVDAPDPEPVDPLSRVTLADLRDASPEAREAAIRQLQGAAADLDEQVPWRVRTNIQIDQGVL